MTPKSTCLGNFLTLPIFQNPCPGPRVWVRAHGPQGLPLPPTNLRRRPDRAAPGAHGPSGASADGPATLVRPTTFMLGQLQHWLCLLEASAVLCCRNWHPELGWPLMSQCRKYADFPPAPEGEQRKLYIYTTANPCISLHGVGWSTVKRHRAENS